MSICQMLTVWQTVSAKSLTWMARLTESSEEACEPSLTVTRSILQREQLRLSHVSK